MGDERTTGSGGSNLGAGGEAAAGMHARQENGDTAAENGEARPARDKDSARSGSEPVAHETEHKPGYGGEGGAPRA